jgi:hypothetical protein
MSSARCGVRTARRARSRFTRSTSGWFGRKANGVAGGGHPREALMQGGRRWGASSRGAHARLAPLGRSLTARSSGRASKSRRREDAPHRLSRAILQSRSVPEARGLTWRVPAPHRTADSREACCKVAMPRRQAPAVCNGGCTHRGDIRYVLNQVREPRNKSAIAGDAMMAAPARLTARSWDGLEMSKCARAAGGVLATA